MGSPAGRSPRLPAHLRHRRGGRRPAGAHRRQLSSDTRVIAPPPWTHRGRPRRRDRRSPRGHRPPPRAPPHPRNTAPRPMRNPTNSSAIRTLQARSRRPAAAPTAPPASMNTVLSETPVARCLPGRMADDLAGIADNLITRTAESDEQGLEVPRRSRKAQGQPCCGPAQSPT